MQDKNLKNEETLNENEFVMKINNLIHSWIEENFGYDVEVVCSDSFAVYPEDEDDLVLFWSFFTSEEADEDFKDFLKETFKFNLGDISPWEVSLCHEIGHIMTAFMFSNKQFRQHHYVADALGVAAQENSEDREEMRKINKAYFAIPVELAATTWAVDFLKTNRAIVKELFDKAMSNITSFYDSFIEKGEIA